MKKLILTLLTISISLVFTNFKKEEIKGIFDFKTEVIDYGTIIQNSNGERYFEFTNKGINPIIIEKVVPSCGCTNITKPNAPVNSGKSGRIGITFDTKRLGKFNKSIKVYSNAKKEVKVLRIKGEIIKEYTPKNKTKSIIQSK